MDCDGVLTDGRLYFSARGEEIKVFDVRDGQGIVLWHKSGRRSGIISGRGSSEIIQRRADELGIEFVRTSSVDKVRDFEEILSVAGLAAEQVAYVGDDVGDIEVMKRVGFSIAVAEATSEVKEIADHITINGGGRGAVREVVDLLLSRTRK
jgi:YrbI family 3-deoxy-D-manno-octulosonate 8-phosphate phosphatase